MYKILTANAARLRRDLLFWSCFLASGIISLVNVHDMRRQLALGYGIRLDDCFFNSLPFLCLIFSVSASFFLGTEYSDGTVRNKLAVGHTRGGIYAAHLFTCTAVSLLFTALALLTGLGGIPVLGPFRMGPKELAVYITLTLLSSAALASLCTLIGMLSGSKAGTVALSLLVSLGLLLLGSFLYNALCEPEMAGGLVLTSEGIQQIAPSPNPDYVGGFQRTVYAFLLDVLPTGQAILMANLDLSRPLLNGAASLLLFVGFWFLGAALFRKKDLK